MPTTQSETIASAANAALSRSSVAELRHIRVDEHPNELQLHGKVRSFYHKQLAQEAVRPVAMGLRVVNHLDVTA